MAIIEHMMTIQATDDCGDWIFSIFRRQLSVLVFLSMCVWNENFW